MGLELDIRPRSYGIPAPGVMASVIVLSTCVGCAPEPVPVPASLAEGCLAEGCHAQVERIHYGGPPLGCVDCHLGDPAATTKEAAHVTVSVSFNPSTPGGGFMADPSMAELEALPLDVIQFLNPSDYRVAARTCGSAVLGGGGCHGPIVETSLLMNRATLAGTFAGGGFMAGVQDKLPRFGVVAVADALMPATLPPGTEAALERLPDDPPATVTDPKARAFYPVFEQLCVECHVYRDGPRIPGRYYSSGCNACHMLTSDDARAATADPTQDREELGHVRVHRLTNEIPDRQCAHCHISHLGRSLLAQGVRERSEPEGDEAVGGPNRGVEDPEDAVPWGQENYVKSNGLLWNYGKPYPYFLADEDGTNAEDETPPDVHTAKGLACIDCHNIREAHGKKSLPQRMDRELDVRCQSCHGRPGELASLASDSGFMFTKSGTAAGDFGFNLTVFSKAADGSLQERGKIDKAQHPVTQITERTDPTADKYNARTAMGCELHAGTAAAKAALKAKVNALAASDPEAVAAAYPGLPAGFDFDTTAPETDGRVECFSCHNAWTPNCYGCHMVRDDRETYTSKLSGKVRAGKVSTFGLSVLADSLTLGFNARGRISPMVGTSIFFTHIDASGKKVIDAEPLRTGEGREGDGNLHNPAHHHTIQKLPRDCDGCHPSVTGSHDAEAVSRVTGLGSSRYTFTDGEGRVHWLDRLVAGDWNGDGEADDPTAFGLPDELLGAEPRVGTTHDSILEPGYGPEPGPLDLETINRILKNRVVPQREKKGPP